MIPDDRASERIVEKIVEVAQIITQKRVQNRTVKQIVEVATCQWNDSSQDPKRVVEQIIDVQKPQVLEKIVKVPKITQQVEDTQYRQSAVGENLNTVSSEQIANIRTVNPVEVKPPKTPQDDDAEKAFTRTGKVPGEQASRRCSEGQDHQDEIAVKEDPTIKEKSQPREQAKRNSSDSRSLRRSSWAYQAPVAAQR